MSKNEEENLEITPEQITELLKKTKEAQRAFHKIAKNLGDIIKIIEPCLGELPEPSRQPVKPKTPGSEVWAVYSDSYMNKYGVEPTRNSKTNAACKQLFERLGLDNAKILAKEYLKMTDQWYVKKMHSLEYCLKDCESLLVRVQTGTTMTDGKARSIEQAGQSLNASQTFLEKKYGDN